MKKNYVFVRVMLVLATISLIFGGVAMGMREEKSVENKVAEVEPESEVDWRGDVKAETWDIERLYKEGEVSYSLIDDGILSVNEGLKEWVNEHKDEAGVYSYEETPYTYVMISKGKENNDKTIILYDARESRQAINIGFNLIEVEGEQNENQSRFMLVRFEDVSKNIQGILISE